MHLLNLSEDILKDFIFEHLLISVTQNKTNEDYFQFKWNEDKSCIIYHDVDFYVYGNSCWEDSEQKEKHTKADSNDINFFGEFFNSFLIEEYIIHKQFENNATDQYLYYINNFKEYYDYWHFIREDTRQEDEDCYYNYSRVRELTIDVDSILKHLNSLAFVKPLDKAVNVFHNLPDENLNKVVMFSHFNNTFPEKNITTKKIKI